MAAAAVLANSRRSTSATEEDGGVMTAPTNGAHQAVAVRDNSFMALKYFMSCPAKMRWT